jgi:hypothetical protein
MMNSGAGILGRVEDAMQAINGVFREGQVVAQINQNLPNRLLYS